MESSNLSEFRVKKKSAQIQDHLCIDAYSWQYSSSTVLIATSALTTDK